jgi:hypothetical protein
VSHGVCIRNSSDSDTESEEENWHALEDRKRVKEQERRQAQVRKQLVYEQREGFGGYEALKQHPRMEHEQHSEQPTQKRVKHTPIEAKAKAKAKEVVIDDEMIVSFQVDADGVVLID